MIYEHILACIIVCTALLGCALGALGSFVILRNNSFLGDMISHAALPGIAATFFITHSVNPALLMLGGICSGIISVFGLHIITHYTRIKKETAIGIILSVFFGIGLVIISHIQKHSIAQQAVLNKFLFGCIATLLLTDTILIFLVSVGILTIVWLLHKEFTLSTFDPSFAHTIGFSNQTIEIINMMLLVVAMIIGLHAVGVILVSTLLIAPAAAARQWAMRMPLMMLYAMFIGSACCISGTVLSCYVRHIPTGPTITILLCCVVVYSLLYAPHRGIWFANSCKRTFGDQECNL